MIAFPNRDFLICTVIRFGFMTLICTVRCTFYELMLSFINGYVGGTRREIVNDLFAYKIT